MATLRFDGKEKFNIEFTTYTSYTVEQILNEIDASIKGILELKEGLKNLEVEGLKTKIEVEE